ncbi:retrotransposon protein, putative, ty1-copia subclass [Tanacetum coccineum]
MGYSFYYPPENKVLVARNAEFLEIRPYKSRASEIDEPQSDIVPIRRSTSTRRPTDRMCLYIDAEEHKLGYLDEPANYKAALLDLESDKWLNAMNVEMQSIKDNKVWVLVELPPNGNIVGSKWLFKKKIDMDRAVHTYKACLMAKGYTQTPGIDYEEPYSPVAYIRDIRISPMKRFTMEQLRFCQSPKSSKRVISYLKCGFDLNDFSVEAAYILEIKIYIDRSRRLIGLCQSAYIEKILKRFHMENSKRGSIPMQEKLRLSKSQGASTPAELKRMQNILYASSVGDLHWTTIKNILKYLKNTKDMFLTGYVFVLNGGVVDWKSAKQSIFATLSAEAEYIAAFDAFKEAV